MGLDIFHFKPAKADETQMLEYFTLDELAHLPKYAIENQEFVTWIQIADEPPLVPVIYFETVGYQRKQMSASFYNDFENDAIFGNVSACFKALTYIEGIGIRETMAVRKDFRENFIDSFEEGKSLFFVNW